MDSVVLLHLLHKLSPRFSWKLSALHVHHGISPNADSWAYFCAQLCNRYNISLQIEHVNIMPMRDQHGVEAAARKLRHDAFSKQACDFVVLAHHADDQAETLLLQLLRGAGVKGAAAMPILKPGTAMIHKILRPLLEIQRRSLLDYAQQNELHWIEDESNTDTYYPRNFLRQRVLPLLEEKFPSYRDTLVRSSQHFAEAAELLDELAQQDAQGWDTSSPIEILLLQTLTRPRAKNLLRFVLQNCGAPMPPVKLLDELLRQLLDAKEDTDLCIEYGGWQVRCYQNKAYVLRELVNFDPDIRQIWQGESELAWPASNLCLQFNQTQGQGMSLKKLQSAPVTFRLRSGGEKLRPFLNAPTRSLKNLLQEHKVPPWMRERLPLMFCGDELVCVVGVAIAANYYAEPDETGLLVSSKKLVYYSANKLL
jgi:tRNA(Ile)-lysidine synthase